MRSGEPLTAEDLAELQRILVAAGIGNDDTFAAASAKAGSFGRFVRSLVGLDRAAAKVAFAEFLDEKRYSKNQITFVNLIIDELTERGVIDTARVYETPYADVAPKAQKRSSSKPTSTSSSPPSKPSPNQLDDRRPHRTSDPTWVAGLLSP